MGDILEANKIVIASVAVDYGYHSKKTLMRGNPIKIISNLSELKNIIEEIYAG